MFSQHQLSSTEERLMMDVFTSVFYLTTLTLYELTLLGQGRFQITSIAFPIYKDNLNIYFNIPTIILKTTACMNGKCQQDIMKHIRRLLRALFHLLRKLEVNVINFVCFLSHLVVLRPLCLSLYIYFTAGVLDLGVL